jgi:hypothetical protein
MIEKEVIRSACWSFWPIAWIAFVYLISPGFIIPFLNHPIGRLMQLAGLVWLLIGFFVRRKCSKWWQRLIATLIFSLPVALIPLLAPAIITIILAFGPMPQNK